MADLTTTEYTKTHLGITGSTQDTLLAQLISSISQFSIDYTGRSFINDDYDERHDGDSSEDLFVKEYPINSVTSVSRNDGTLGSPTWTAYDSDEYYSDTNVGMIIRSGGYPVGTRNIRVVYNAGYGASASDMPTDLQTAIADLVGYMVNKQKKQGIRNVRTGTFGVTYSGGTSSSMLEEVPTAKIVLDLYRKVQV